MKGSVRGESTFVAGLDVGGTKTLAAVVAPDGEIVAQTLRPTDVRGPEALLATITAALVEVSGEAGLRTDALAAVGIGVPGLVNPATGALRHAVNLGVGDGAIDLSGPVGRIVDGPVVVANDTNLAALGAAHLSGGASDLAYLSLGTGVSVGFVLGGVMHRGASGMAGEIGHVPVDPDGIVCQCGQRGCLETLISGTAIARRWPRDDKPMASLLAAASNGDAEAKAVRDEICGDIAVGVALAAQATDPQVVALGGGVAEAGEPLADAVRWILRSRAERSPLLRAFGLADRLRVVPPAASAGALGAALAARTLWDRSEAAA